jgi:hypothetical protein
LKEALRREPQMAATRRTGLADAAAASMLRLRVGVGLGIRLVGPVGRRAGAGARRGEEVYKYVSRVRHRRFHDSLSKSSANFSVLHLLP